MDSKVERIKKWMEGKKRGPVRVELHPTDRCNLDCRFCWRKGDNEIRPEKELSKDKLIDIVDEAADMGVEEWIISGGGEPMLRKETTLQVMERIKEHGMWGQLTTNGCLLKEEDVERIVDMRWDQVQISIDGPDARTHNFIRQEDYAFRKSVKASKMISSEKKRQESSNPYLGYNTIIHNRVHDKLEEMIVLADSAGSQLVYFEPIYPGYSSKVRLELDEGEKKEMVEHVDRAERLAEELDVDTNIGEYREKYSIDKDSFGDRVIGKVQDNREGFLGAPCYQPWYLLGIKGSGLVGCCSTFEEGVYIHDRSLKEVWFSKKFQELREEMLEKDIPEYCSKCSVVVLKSNERIRKILSSGSLGLNGKLKEKIGEVF